MMKMNLQLFSTNMADILAELQRTGQLTSQGFKPKEEDPPVKPDVGDDEPPKTYGASYQAEPVSQQIGTLKGVDSNLMNTMNSQFNVSAAYTEAMNYTNELLKKISEGRTSYTDQIKSLMDEIQNRPKFEYDVNSDPMFQQALASAMGSGKTAMQDTIGQASALTGGYGSTYATTAGNQAYNSFIEDAYNNLPEYYEMALQAYQMEGDEMYNQLSMLNTADATEFQRMYDSWGANFSSAQQMYANEYQKWSDEVSNAFNLASMQNADWWNTTNFNESQRQHKAEIDYKNAALAQDQAQFDATMEYNKTNKGSGSDTQNAENSKLTNSEIKGIKDAYRGAGGGTKGYQAVEAYLDSLGKNVSNSTIDSLLASAEAEDGLPVWYQTWTISKDTKNRNNPFVKGNDDMNDQYTNLNGQTATFKELKKAIEKSSLSKEEKEKALESLRKQSQK